MSQDSFCDDMIKVHQDVSQNRRSGVQLDPVVRAGTRSREKSVPLIYAHRLCVHRRQELDERIVCLGMSDKRDRHTAGSGFEVVGIGEFPRASEEEKRFREITQPCLFLQHLQC